MSSKLYRSRSNAMVGGVASGLSEFFGLDATVIRLVWLFTILLGGTGLFLYLIAWIIIPPAPEGDPTTAFEKSEHIRQQVIDTAKDFEAQWKGEHHSSTPEEIEQRESRRRQALGWILIAIGVLLLARNLFSWLAIGHLWPIIIIIAGAVIIMQGFRK